MHVPLREGIDWVGYVDWTVRDFHSYNTERGTTYNAYLIRDEQTALIDTVKEPFGNDLLANVSALVDPAKVDWVVCNHAEPDHSGVLPQVLAAMPNATLVCNAKCLLALSKHFDTAGWKTKIVAPGDVLSLGKRTLEFINTPMAHWPESMFTYIRQEKILFSMDAFGQHCATTERFDDENCIGTVLEEARTYYANILMPYGTSTAKAMASVTDLEIDMIATSHGVIWRSHIPQILDAYRQWTSGKYQPKIIILYDTMWESTAAMARAFEEGAAHPGVHVKVIHVRRNSLTTIAADVFDAAAVAIGSATLNGTMMPQLGAAFCYLEGLKPTAKAAVGFGSYGWGRGSAEAIQEGLERLKWNVLRAPIKAQYKPTPEILEECRAAGALLARKALEMSGAAG
jgi:flavorubredoxin